MHDKTIEKNINIKILNNNDNSNNNIVKNKLKEKENENLNIIKETHFIEKNSRCFRVGSPVNITTQIKSTTKISPINPHISNTININRNDIGSSTSSTTKNDNDNDNWNSKHFNEIGVDEEKKKEWIRHEEKRIQFDPKISNININRPTEKSIQTYIIDQEFEQSNIQDNLQSDIRDNVQNSKQDNIQNIQEEEDRMMDNIVEDYIQNSTQNKIQDNRQDNNQNDRQNDIQDYIRDNTNDKVNNNLPDNLHNNLQHNIEHNNIHVDLQSPSQLPDNTNHYLNNNGDLNNIASTSTTTYDNNITVTLPVPITNDIFIDRSDLNYNYTLNENIYNFSEGLIHGEERELMDYSIDHESIAITLVKMAKLLDDYTNTKKFLRAWEYWFFRWSNCRWYIQRQNHWLSKQKKAKQKLLQMIE
ncbi:hypothetical protein PIROE2DRAFT_17613, partial [Piromyces sp. E2]